ncbi:MAG: hydantoinase/oxoprolinase family protein [Candidatus Binatia bacterium]
MAAGELSSPIYLGVDTGGTFTDLVQIDRQGRLRIEKAFSTPSQPEQGVIDVLAQLAGVQKLPLSDMLAKAVRFAHGTTISTNALIERKGSTVGLLATRGFEDTLQIARGPIGRAGGIPRSKAMDFIHTNPAEPLVPKSRIRGLGERVTVSGEVLAPLDENEVRDALRELLDEGIESLAVCLLWSFRNPVHEWRVREIASGTAPDLPVFLSCEIAPRIGEFERTVTTVINAFVGPLTQRYIGSLQKRLKENGLKHPVQVMKSSGGLTLSHNVGQQAVSVVNSGPIGGLVAARHVGRLLGYDNVITADMGGTSFDVGLISRGDYEEQCTPFLDQGLPVQVPTINVVTIGAGGGSIAWTDGYRLQVGPHSAGVVPGPACYERGGDQPTVTDALVVLGIINPSKFFGGRYVLNADLARSAIEDRLAKPLGLDVMQAAAGIYEVVTAKMGDLIRKVTIESGNDPRRFCLFAYGGAGGAHCSALAAKLGIGKVIIPYAAPVFSAFGIALSDILYSHTQSAPAQLSADPPTIEVVNRTFAGLESRALADMIASGIDQNQIALLYRIDMRYEGQMNEVSLPWGKGRLGASDIAELQGAFEALYQQKFGAGTIRSETPLELISFRVDALKFTEKPPLVPFYSKDTRVQGDVGPYTRRSVYRHGKDWLEADIYDFEELGAGFKCNGPAVIERQNMTIWLPPASLAEIDVYGNLKIDPGS